ncbi:MAG TPA: hypothetical protein VET24_07165, partial [Actinomycetota bacterium]|nr:hypothetical protein [Actinomycetota bacterium]
AAGGGPAVAGSAIPDPHARRHLRLPFLTPDLDFAYPDVLLVLEADSYIWYSSREAWKRDRARNNELVALGWSILPITYDLVVGHPATLVRQVGTALERRRAC